MFLVDGIKETADMISRTEIDPSDLYRMSVRCHTSPQILNRAKIRRRSNALIADEILRRPTL